MSEPTPAVETQAGDALLAALADDFLRRHRAGERPTVDKYAQKHAELADQIRDLFPAMMAMEQPEVTPPAERPGATIGRYKLLERLGEGGYGVVFMAEQTWPVHRKVALKLIKAGMDTRQVIARFEAERQALALMDHPNIAKVFDAGATDTGRPYFVMELVKGAPITRYCDEHRLDPRQRLELFVQVCQAVQHAHQKGIIHRDLKPSNVLLAQYDGQPVPKVIDFGVAKAMGQRLTERTMFTGFGDVIGTPEYMSPEQAELNQLDIDTRSDIYSLGVLLYELLTGTTPIEHKRVREAALLEVLRVIREEEPPKPSTRLTTMEGLPTVAAQRGLEPQRLTKLVHGELDWIVMKALEKERNRRYETANGFATDIQRYLHDEPILACPPSARYRFRKFARRNKRALIAASAGLTMLLLLVAALAVSNVLIARERNQKAAALKAKEEALALATAQEKLARESAQKAEAESYRSKKNFLAASVAVREVITKAATGSEEWSQLPPPLRQKLSDEAMKFYGSLLQEESTDPSLRYETAVGYRSIALLRNRSGDRKRAEECYRQAITIFEELSTADPQNRNALAWTQYMFGGFLAKGGRSQEAADSWRKCVYLYVELVSEVPDSKQYRDNLGTCLELWHRTQPSEAKEAYRQAAGSLQGQLKADLGREMAWRLSYSPPATIPHDHAMAIELAKQAVESAPKNWDNWNTLGLALYRAGQWEESLAALQRCGTLRPEVQWSNPFFLAMAHWQLGNKDEAREWLARAVDWMEKNEPNRAHLIHFRAEAEELMGLKESKSGR